MPSGVELQNVHGPIRMLEELKSLSTCHDGRCRSDAVGIVDRLAYTAAPGTPSVDPVRYT